MNYSTMPQTAQPLLNREVKVNVKTILCAAAFTCGAQSHLPLRAARRRDARVRRCRRAQVLRDRLARCGRGGALSSAGQGHGHGVLQPPRLERRRNVRQKGVRPQLHEQRQLPVQALPALYVTRRRFLASNLVDCLLTGRDTGNGYRCTSHGEAPKATSHEEIHPKATSTCEKELSAALKKLHISQEQDKLHQLAMGGIKFSEAVSDGQLDEQLETLRKKVEIAELREKLGHLGG